MKQFEVCLQETLGGGLRRQEDMKKHTSFHAGGTADYFAIPRSTDQLKKVLSVCQAHQMPYFILGRGTNLLVQDGGFHGVIIQLVDGFQSAEIHGESDSVTAETGILLSKLAEKAAKYGLSGLEFASGIPGTLGGAIYMNAGAYDGEMADIVHHVTVLCEDGTVKTLAGEEMQFGYRRSRAQKENMIVLSAVLKLHKGNTEEIRQRIDTFSSRRQEKQPLELPSAGSTFKRPEGYFAGQLIMESGLQGFTLGGAAVSEKHCGFIVNRGNATAADITALIAHVQYRVRQQFGVELEPEVRIIGEPIQGNFSGYDDQGS